MAEKIVKWKSDDGTECTDEITALKRDIAFWQKRAKSAEAWIARQTDKNPRSSYGSSGGGGHD